ncbi:hypothetical protein Pst134EA_026604 [Puccinia striiformis f. sp. tritici]|uniref:hypothetical protein n=1 Tax=Puccinia striiformis f. sp. tritici TaxID=168172 RepID=UPI00200896A5|nr:hypothetical protein Pst134EA_026604 [Puccinia striiformis f. sp. tritici]KAH9442804.1 hypothetical protein Pst134EB_027159 [Puccinia striiformis f. sp. tritici]KAH9449887.1 hypothetical protein Pst134EA_026604 [Puccinia striiformis f. sp. tritici]
MIMFTHEDQLSASSDEDQSDTESLLQPDDEDSDFNNPFTPGLLMRTNRAPPQMKIRATQNPSSNRMTRTLTRSVRVISKTPVMKAKAITTLALPANRL